MNERLHVQVRAIADLTPRIRSYELVRADDASSLPPFTAGSHVTLYLPSGIDRQYSLYNDPADAGRYCIAVQREDAGRGGSLEVHRTFGIGSELEIAPPKNLFPLSENHQSPLLIAGGIGITPILAMARHLARQRRSFQLVYLARDPHSAAFLAELKAISNCAQVICHFDEGSPVNSFDIRGLLNAAQPGTHVYCCGPIGLMDTVRNLTSRWPQETVHFEYFSNDTAALQNGDRPFAVRLARTGRTISVKPGQTILDALLSAGLDVDYSCTEGTCGTCVVTVLEGEVEHRDKVLLPSEQATKIAICCSRAKSALITIDL